MLTVSQLHSCTPAPIPSRPITPPPPPSSFHQLIEADIYLLFWVSRYNQCCESALLWCRSGSGSGSEFLNFHIDAVPDPDTAWHQNDANPQNFYFIFSHSIASLQCFIFIIRVKCAIIFRIFDTILKFSGKSQVYQLFNLLGLDTVSDRYSLNADPDPAKWCGSSPIRIRIHNTSWQWLTCERVSTLFSTFFVTRTLSFFKNCIYIGGWMGEGQKAQSPNDYIT